VIISAITKIVSSAYHHYYNDEKSGFTQYETGNVKKELEPTSISADTWSHENGDEDYTQ
jgi:hypothetical protein